MRELNWMATCQLMKSIEGSITQLESGMKQTSRLINEGKLEQRTLEYLARQVEDYEKAIKQLKEFWDDLVDIKWDNLATSGTPPPVIPVETSV